MNNYEKEADVKTDFRKTLVLIDGREFREGWRQCEHIYYVPATSEHDYGRYFVIFNKRVRPVTRSLLGGRTDGACVEPGVYRWPDDRDR